MVERRTVNALVVGSSPTPGAKSKMAKMKNYECDLCSSTHETKIGFPKPVGWTSMAMTRRIKNKYGQEAYNVFRLFLCEACTLKTQSIDSQKLSNHVKNYFLIHGE